MTENEPSVLLFGDVVCEKLPTLRKLYAQAQIRPQLQRFLTHATEVIHQECSALQASERIPLREFDDVLQLGEWHAAQENPDVLTATTLLAIIQLGEYLM